jgi:hypothetical protein
MRNAEGQVSIMQVSIELAVYHGSRHTCHRLPFVAPGSLFVAPGSLFVVAPFEHDECR